MKTNINFLLTALIILLVISMFNGCEKDDETKLFPIYGVVTYNNGQLAPNATISVSSLPNSSKVFTNISANENGEYAVRLEKGLYYIYAKFTTTPENVNTNQYFGFVAPQEYSVQLNSSYHLDISLVPDSATDYISRVKLNNWKQDTLNSNLVFSFPYDSIHSDFVGQFKSIRLQEFSFDGKNPLETIINVSVDLTSAFTNSPTHDSCPGRDGINGFIAQALGVKYQVDGPEDTTITGYYTESAIIQETRYATFTSINTDFYGDGYKTTGKLFLNGRNMDADLYFLPPSETFDRISFSGSMVIDPVSEFNILVDQIKTFVIITINLQFIN
jgi:polyisoprenoid-binding protein YceI